MKKLDIEKRILYEKVRKLKENDIYWMKKEEKEKRKKELKLSRINRIKFIMGFILVRGIYIYLFYYGSEIIKYYGNLLGAKEDTIFTIAGIYSLILLFLMIQLGSKVEIYIKKMVKKHF